MDIQTPNSAPGRPMNKQVIVGIVIGLVVIIGGILLWSGNRPGGQPGPAPVVEQPATPKTAQEIAKRETAILDTSRNAIGSRDEDKCSQLLTEDERDTCRAYVITSDAQNKLDATLCDAISALYWKNNCKDQVTTYKAISSRNPGLCSGMLEKDRVSMCRKAVGL